MNFPAIGRELARQLDAIEASTGGDRDYRPCRVLLRSGDVVDRVYVVEGTSYMSVWDVLPTDDPDKNSVSIDDVVRIEESPYRLPAAHANKLYSAGESGMGYCVFTVVLRDGAHLPFVTGNAVDFPALPAGITSADIADVLPHTGEPRDDEGSADYSWCLYQRD